MAVFTDPREIEFLREGGRRLAKVMRQLEQAVRPGITTKELDALAGKLIKAEGGEPSFLNYRTEEAKIPFPASLCVSVNEEVVHGIPGERQLREGDIVGLDLGLKYRGFYTDMAVTVAVGHIDDQKKKLIEVTKKALERAISVVRPGRPIGDIGAAIQDLVEPHGFGIIYQLGGHGLGRAVHEKPYIPNLGKKGEGPRLRQGEVIAIEPMLALGEPRVKTLADGYTIVTADGSPAAHFEHTILVTNEGSEILTKL